MIRFIKNYIKSMRLYYAFITGIAGWLGMAFYEYIAESPFRTVEAAPSAERKAVILILLFLSWGINQIINDFLGLKEDRINAPHRPMVTGELESKAALSVSVILMAISMTVTWVYLEPIAVIPEVLGILLNILYEYAKGHGLLGNIVFGLMITMCSAIGFLAAGPTQAPYFTPSRVSVLMLVWIMNGVMTYYTFFKDYKGDKAANKRTLVVIYGLRKSRVVAMASSFIPGLAFLTIYCGNFIAAPVNHIFLILAVLTVFLQIRTGFLYFRNPFGEKTYYSLATNFRACACGQASLIALFNTELAMILFIVSYMLIGFLFNLYANSKA